ncbi:MAG TPA: hypothetical protein VND87_06095 [Stellaceae bacterium]|nr:hypothetical protein [Stellaceae bacterium]
MSVFHDVRSELRGMFLGDARLAVATLAIVAFAGAMAASGAGGFAAGCVLVFGCLAILVEAVYRETRQRGR